MSIVSFFGLEGSSVSKFRTPRGPLSPSSLSFGGEKLNRLRDNRFFFADRVSRGEVLPLSCATKNDVNNVFRVVNLAHLLNRSTCLTFPVWSW